ncbi:UNVERIFIED_CONTAM: hypothetical protein FKN15_024865 [Acipenser sinensis]
MRISGTVRCTDIPGAYLWPTVEEILQRSHRERKVSRQVAALLPPRAPAWGKSSRWQFPQAHAITRTVPVPAAPLGDLRHCLQSTAAAGNWVLPQGRGNAGRGASMQQRSKWQFQGSSLSVLCPNLSRLAASKPSLHDTPAAILERLHLRHLGARHRVHWLRATYSSEDHTVLNCVQPQGSLVCCEPRTPQPT